MVKLSRDGISRRHNIHILVARAFVEGYNLGLEVNHKDTNRTNNTAENLEWLTHAENVAYSANLGKYKHYGADNSNYGGTKLKDYYAAHPEEKALLGRPGAQNGRATPIIMFDLDWNEIGQFNYIAECSNYLIDKGIAKCKHPYSASNYIAKALKENGVAYGHRYKYA